MVTPKVSTELRTASSIDAAASAAASLASLDSLPPCETDERGAPVTSSLGTAWSAVSDERHAPTISPGFTWSNEEPMVVDDEAAPYNSNSAARRGEDSTNGGRHEDGDEDATASHASPQDNVPAVEFDRSEGEIIVYHISSLSHADSRIGVTQFW